jgi:hypothetical protein
MMNATKLVKETDDGQMFSLFQFVIFTPNDIAQSASANYGSVC